MLTCDNYSIGNDVSAVVETQYPFSDTLETTITATKAFVYQVRIPGWVVEGTISIDGGQPQPLKPVNGLHPVEIQPGTSKFTLNLPALITTGMSIPFLIGFID